MSKAKARGTGIFTNWPETRSEFLFGVFLLIVSTVTMGFLLQHARLPLLVVEALLHLFMTGIAIASYYAGKQAVHAIGMKPWATYGYVYVLTCLLVLVFWAGHGSEIVEWDLRSGPTVISEDTPSRRASSEFAGQVFLGILPAALFGVYRANKEKKEAELFECGNETR